MVGVGTVEGLQHRTIDVHRQRSITAQHNTFRSCNSSAVSDAQYNMHQIQQGQVVGTLPVGNVCMMNMFVKY